MFVLELCYRSIVIIWKTLLLVATFGLMICSQLSADVIYLKSGGMIKNCRVSKRDDVHLHIRTRTGTMAVPRDNIKRIVTAKSIFDTYDEKLRQIDNKNTMALFELSEWCRKAGGLRKEMTALHQQIIKVNPNHPAARRKLGYMLVDRSWKLAPPLTIHLEVTSGKDLKRVFEDQLKILVEQYPNIELSSAALKEQSFRACKLQTALVTFVNRGASFYGQRIRGPTSRATIRISVRAAWARSALFPLVLEGETPLAVPKPGRQAIIDAVVRNTMTVHTFLDRLLESRILHLEAAYRAEKTR